MPDIKQLPSVAGIEKYVDAVLSLNPAMARELKGKIVEALGQAKYEERQRIAMYLLDRNIEQVGEWI
jgi:hypothetical protein